MRSRSGDENKVRLPWWTWVLPVLIFHIGTELSRRLELAPGTSLWYLPLEFGFVLIQWWGPRVLVGLYVNALLSAGMWGLTHKINYPLYAVPETAQVFLSWFLFTYLGKGKPWLPDLNHTLRFAFLVVFVPVTLGTLLLESQFLLLGDIERGQFWHLVFGEWTGDMLASLALCVPILLLATAAMERRGLSLTKGAVDEPVWRPNVDRRAMAVVPGGNLPPGAMARQVLEVGLVFAVFAVLSLFLDVHGHYWLYGLFGFWAALRYGVGLASIANLWIILWSLVVPAYSSSLLAQVSSHDGLIANIYISLGVLCFGTVTTGRLLSDMRNEAKLREVTEQELRLRERQFRIISDNTADVIWMYDFSEGRYTYVNGSVEAMFGYSPDEVLRMSIEGTLTPERAELVEAELGERFAACRAGDMSAFVSKDEIDQLRKDGSTISTEVVTTIIPDEDGNLKQIVGVTRDVSERAAAEQSLRESQQHAALLADLLERSSQPFSVGFPNGQIGICNPAFERLTGYTRDELAAIDWARVLTPPEWAEVERAKLEELTRNRDSVRYEKEYIRKDGVRVPVDLLVHVALDESGEPEYFYAFVTDISVRREAEEALRRSEEKFRTIFETIEDAYITANLEGTVRTVNPALVRMLGYDSASDLVGLNTARDLYADPTDCQVIVQRLKVEGTVHNYPVRFRKRNGDVLSTESNIRLILDDDGQEVAVEGTFRDVTERIRTEDELKRYREHLEELVADRTAELTEARNQAEAANRAKSLFLANMSHELRTPLNAVLGFSHLMLTAPDVSTDQRKTLEIINRSGGHLLRLINDVLDVARIEAGREQVTPQDFNTAVAVNDVIDMMRGRAEEKQISLVLEQSPTVPRLLRSDEAKIRQILINLIGNAIKFTPAGTVSVRLRCEASDAQPIDPDRLLLKIEVEDTGPGIAQEQQATIFRPFVQIGTPAEQKGSGLGLTITKHHVELMDGEITLESTVGKGSCFKVTIPVESAKSGGAVGHQDGRRPTGIAPGSPEYRILIVEDVIENSELLRLLLVNMGFTARVAENGLLAVEMFVDWAPDFIWMDRRMPVMDGIEATKRIRELPGGRDVKIVGLTASAFANERVEAMAAGMDDCVGKPFLPHEIFDCMAELLGVEYVYEDHAPLTSMPLSELAGELAALPENLKAELQTALLMLDTAQISSIVRHIGSENASLGKALQERADALQFSPILKALQGSL